MDHSNRPVLIPGRRKSCTLRALQRERAKRGCCEFAACVVIALTLAVVPARAQYPGPAPLSGIRVAPTPPGVGGSLRVIAPLALCVDAAHDLMVRRFVDGGGIQFVVRAPAGPSRCHWDVEGVPPGEYDALIQARSDGRIAATARGTVLPAVTTLLSLESPSVEIVGVVSIDGVPVKEGFRLMFKRNGPTFWNWEAPIAADGTYHVVVEGEDVAAWILRSQPLNSVVRYGPFHPGVQRFDIDLPPGIIRIRVAPLPSAAANDDALIEVGGCGGGGGRWFKLAQGFQGDHFGSGYGEFTVCVKTVDSKLVLASERVRLSEKQPDAEVTLTPVRSR